MYHMKSVSIRDLRYRFPRVEAKLREGEELAITRRNRVIARLLPEKPAKPSVPDFSARLKANYGNEPAEVSGAELISLQRGDR